MCLAFRNNWVPSHEQTTEKGIGTHCSKGNRPYFDSAAQIHTCPPIVPYIFFLSTLIPQFVFPHSLLVHLVVVPSPRRCRCPPVLNAYPAWCLHRSQLVG